MPEVRLVFFGNERLVSGLEHTDAPILRQLISDGYKIVAVVSNHTESRSRNQRPLEVAAIAETHNIPVLLPAKPGDIARQLKDLDAEAGVLVAYGRIIPQSVIDIFPKGIINVHPSLLPAYRGPTPIETAIADGKRETGVSIMALAAQMDAGPIYAREKVTIESDDDKFSLYNKIVQLSAELLSDTLPGILDDTVTAQVQNTDRATYCALFTSEDSWLHPDTQTAAEAERVVRAHLGFPKSKLSLYGHDIVVRKVSVSPEAHDLSVTFKDQTHLMIDELIGPSGKVMSGAEFLRGYAK